MGRAFEYRKATKLKRWGNMARTFTRIGKQIAIAVKAGGPDPENNPHLRAVVATAKRENMPKEHWVLPVALILCSVGNPCSLLPRKKDWKWMN